MTNCNPDDLRDRIIAALRRVRDPEIPVNIYDLGLIYDLDVTSEGDAHVRMTLTSPNCPVAEALPAQVEQTIRAQEGVREAQVELVWEPPWSRERMTEEGRLELELSGVADGGGSFIAEDSLLGRRDRHRP